VTCLPPQPTIALSSSCLLTGLSLGHSPSSYKLTHPLRARVSLLRHTSASPLPSVSAWLGDPGEVSLLLHAHLPSNLPPCLLFHPAANMAACPLPPQVSLCLPPCWIVAPSWGSCHTFTVLSPQHRGSLFFVGEGGVDWEGWQYWGLNSGSCDC
jgi:hypothetical protein